MAQKPKRPLKVCCTCQHWSHTYKGFCGRVQQGVGKFWSCENWAAGEPPAQPQPPRGATAAAPGR